jgi:pimeloyl-ACP methyl ester carboxylesterase
MGELRSSYRFLAPFLVQSRCTVATMDLRGHGDSDTSFRSYDDVAAGSDVIALLSALDARAIVVGNSMGAGAAAWAAAEAPGQIAGLVLIGPFVRQVRVGWAMALLFRAAMMRPWGRAAWVWWYAKLFPGRRPPDFDAHRRRIAEILGRPGHWQAFAATTRTSHAPVEARLADVRAPTLVVMGASDPDFPDPAAEARWIAERLHGETLVVPNAGHYPQAEYPELVAPAVLGFIRRVFGDRPWR